MSRVPSTLAVPALVVVAAVTAWSGSSSQAPFPGGIVAFTLNW